MGGSRRRAPTRNGSPSRSSRPRSSPGVNAGVREHQAVTWAKRLAKRAIAVMVFSVSPSRILSENTSRVTASKERPPRTTARAS